MKIKKSTIVLLVVIAVTILLGAAAVYTSYLLRQRERITEEEAEAVVYAREYCGIVGVDFVRDETYSSGNYTIYPEISNLTGKDLVLDYYVTVFHCPEGNLDACLRNPIDIDETTVTLAEGGSEQLTLSTPAGTEDCGTFQIDLWIKRTVAGGEDVYCSDFNATSSFRGLSAAGLHNTGKACGLCDVLTADPSEISSSTTSVDLSATYLSDVGPTDISATWASSGGGSFDPTTSTDTGNTGQLRTEFTLPTSVSSDITVTADLTGTWYGSSTQNVDYVYSSIGQQLTNGTFYLPGVEHSTSDVTMTEISIYSDAETNTVSLVAYDTGGNSVGGIQYRLRANETQTLTTADLDVPAGYEGTVSVTATKSSAIVYRKIGVGGRGAAAYTAIYQSDGAHVTKNLYLANAISTVAADLPDDGKLFIFASPDGPASGDVTVTIRDWYGATVGDPGTYPLSAKQTVVVDIGDLCVDCNGWASVSSTDMTLLGTSTQYDTDYMYGHHLTSNTGQQNFHFPVFNNGWGVWGTGGFVANPQDTESSATIQVYEGITGAPLFGDGYVATMQPNGTSPFDVNGMAEELRVTLPDNLEVGGTLSGFGGLLEVTTTEDTVVFMTGLETDAAHAYEVEPLFEGSRLVVPGIESAAGTYSGTSSFLVANLSETDPMTGKVKLYGSDGEVVAFGEKAYIPFGLSPKGVTLMDTGLLDWWVPPNWEGSVVVEADSGTGLSTAMGLLVVSVSPLADTEYTDTCSVVLGLEDEPVDEDLSCVLIADPTSVEAGESTALALTITDTEADSSYVVSWTDSPDAGSYSSYDDEDQTTSSTSLSNTYTVSSTTSEDDTRLLATVAKTGGDTVQCTTTLAIDDDGDDDDGDGDGESGTGAGTGTGTQPETAFFLPVLVLPGAGAAFTGAGYWVAKNRIRVAGTIRSAIPRKFETKVVESASRKRKKI